MIVVKVRIHLIILIDAHKGIWIGVKDSTQNMLSRGFQNSVECMQQISNVCI